VSIDPSQPIPIYYQLKTLLLEDIVQGVYGPDGQLPTEHDLSLGAPLRRGDPVVLVSRTGGVEVRMPGRALGPAQSGGRISVENVSSRRVLRGRLVAEGTVELLP
jgi:flagellar basal body P-ring formation protein FlgA